MPVLTRVCNPILKGTSSSPQLLAGLSLRCQGEAWPEEGDAVVDVRVTVVLLVVEEIVVVEVIVVAVVVSEPRRSETTLWHTSFGRRGLSEGIVRSV